jgi:predicted esterase
MIFLAAALAVPASPERGRLVESLVTRSDAEETYTLYLPTGWSAAKRSPALLVLDPRGRSAVAAELFREGAERYGWVILSSNQSRSDVDIDPNPRAVRALAMEAVTVYGVDSRRLYLAGFSGTAIASWWLASQSGGIAGVIGSGGRLVEAIPPEKFNFASYGFAGDTDFNNRQMREIEARLTKSAHVPHRYREFPGPHAWMSAELGTQAIAWMEVMAMKSGLRPRDPELAAAVFEADLLDTKGLEAAGRTLDALRSYAGIASSYEGLVDVSAAREAAARLEADPKVRAEQQAETKWDEFEVSYLRSTLGRIRQILSSLREESLRPSSARLSHELRVSELLKRAKKPGAEGRAAQRLLGSVHAQMSNYLTTEFFNRGEYALAATVLGVAIEIHSDRWPTHYNLGAAYARMGEKKKALFELDLAVANGFSGRDALLADEDWATLRDDSAFQAIAAKLK